MTIWQAVTNDDNESIICQADCVKELAKKLNISVDAVYMFHHRQERCLLKHPGRNKKYKIVKVVIDDD